MTKANTFSPELQRQRAAAFCFACDEVAGMLAAGASDRQMAKALGIPMSAIQQLKIVIQSEAFQ